MPYIEQMTSEDEAWVRLGFFLADVDELFNDLLDARWLLFDQALRASIPRAYGAMRERVFGGPDLLDMGERAPHVWPRALRPGVVEALETEGLTGPELTAKLQGYARARSALFRTGGRRNLARAWRWMKAILQSLGKAFPPAAAILELADLIENGARDVEDLLRDRAV